MESVWETRPLSIHKTRGEWHPNGFASSSSLPSRRRSSAAHVPPPGPPPSQPIPSLPTQYEAYEQYDGMPNSPVNPLDPTPYRNGSYSPPHPYTRPAASASLAAVAAFSRARNINPAPVVQPTSPSDDLSDMPPKSILRAPARSPPATHEIIPDRLLLSPQDSRPEPRPSSRKALTRALELAREAVKLDSTNDDPYGAVMAYGKSVALLSEVMQRVMRGEDSTESHRRKNGRRRSVVAQEEEVKRLKSIHDTYADRMNILSLIYSIPLPTTYSPPTTYASSSVSASAPSTQPSSPVSSSSPTSEASTRTSRTSSSASIRSNPPEIRNTDGTRVELSDSSDGMLAIGNAMFTLDTSTSPGGLSPRTPVAPSVHPYAVTPPPPSTSTNYVNNRTSVATVSSVVTITPPRPQVGRPRASSSLPPAAPPPTSVLPPAPAILEPPAEPIPPQPIAMSIRPRGHSISHRRAGSATKLAALQEEPSIEETQVSSETLAPPTGETGRLRSRSITRESHPLPPLPSATITDPATTPRNPTTLSEEAQSPRSPTTTSTHRTRGGSSASNLSDMIMAPVQTQLINTSPAMGTISQRRTKMSAPPSMVGTPLSPTESIESTASVPVMNRLTASSLPASTANSLGMTGRSRAASQPGRRPSLITHNTYPLPPNSTQVPPRKISIPSKLNPNPPPQITINTALLSPPLAAKAIAPLVPPPPIPHANIPTAPASPMPPTAPPDPLRKPYHMMNLLRQTMTSKTGGYITRRLHVPQEVWSQGGAKLTNIPEKIRVVEVLCTALDEIQNCSVEYFGAGNVSSGLAMGIGSIGKKEAEAWAAKLEEFSNICEGVVSNFGKKLQVGEGFVTKKSSGVTSWGGRLTRQFDKLTNAKNLDSPALYVQGLSKLFNQVQILDEHTKAATSQPLSPLYASFPPDVRAALDIKLKRASEFFAKVVLTFVIRDMALLLDKYVKKCEKWLAE